MVRASGAVHMLPLSPSELWIVRHVLLARIKSGRRPRATDEPPPTEVFRAAEKIERARPGSRRANSGAFAPN